MAEQPEYGPNGSAPSDASEDSCPTSAEAAADLVRLLRTHRRLSQRELAGLAGLRRSTVERIESGATDPRFGTLRRLLEVTGHRIVVLDHRGRPVATDPQLALLRDEAGRHFPAHLPYAKLRDPTSPLYWGWWGWYRIAWTADSNRVPEWSYWRPKRYPHTLRPIHGREMGVPYDDAT